LLDIASHAWGGSVPTIGAGGVMHENHAIMLAVSRNTVANYFPGQTLSDRLLDLQMYINGCPALFTHRAEHLTDLANRLVRLDRVRAGVHTFYRTLAAGYADCADLADEVSKRFHIVYAADLARREAARTDEEWHDYSNV
jgi:hypothetical protein